MQDFFQHQNTFTNVCEITKKSFKGTDKMVQEFLRKKNFHQNLRQEILFGLLPRTLKANTVQERRSQNAALFDLVQRLSYRSILWDEGIKQLGTIIEFDKLTDKSWTFKWRVPKIKKFIDHGFNSTFMTQVTFY